MDDGCHFINSIGQISSKVRNEGQRISDVLGLESLVDEIAHKLLTEAQTPLPPPSLAPSGLPTPHSPLSVVALYKTLLPVDTLL